MIHLRKQLSRWATHTFWQQSLLERITIITVTLFEVLFVVLTLLEMYFKSSILPGFSASTLSALLWLCFLVFAFFRLKRLKVFFTKKPSVRLLLRLVPLCLLVDLLLEVGLNQMARNNGQLSVGSSVFGDFVFSAFISPIWEEIARLGFISFSPFPFLHAASFASAHYPSSLFFILLFFAWGLLFTALTLHTGSLWNSVIVHSLVNFFGFSNTFPLSPIFKVSSTLAGFLLLFILIIYLFRRIDKEKNLPPPKVQQFQDSYARRN